MWGRSLGALDKQINARYTFIACAQFTAGPGWAWLVRANGSFYLVCCRCCLRCCQLSFCQATAATPTMEDHVILAGFLQRTKYICVCACVCNACSRAVATSQHPSHGNWFMCATWLHFGHVNVWRGCRAVVAPVVCVAVIAASALIKLTK